jgi:hypothetical protein
VLAGERKTSVNFPRDKWRLIGKTLPLFLILSLSITLTPFHSLSLSLSLSLLLPHSLTLSLLLPSSIYRGERPFRSLCTASSHLFPLPWTFSPLFSSSLALLLLPPLPHFSRCERIRVFSSLPSLLLYPLPFLLPLLSLSLIFCIHSLPRFPSPFSYFSLSLSLSLSLFLR